MLTLNELNALRVLEKKGDQNPNTYFSAREVGKDEIFHSRPEPVFRPGMNTGGVLGRLHRQGLADMVLFVEDGSAPLRLYRINLHGIDALKRQDDISKERQKLTTSYQLALEHAQACLGELKRFNEQFRLT